jgi:hypothetical protein
MRNTLATIAQAQNKTQGECIEEALAQWIKRKKRKDE